MILLFKLLKGCCPEEGSGKRSVKLGEEAKQVHSLIQRLASSGSCKEALKHDLHIPVNPLFEPKRVSFLQSQINHSITGCIL